VTPPWLVDREPHPVGCYQEHRGRAAHPRRHAPRARRRVPRRPPVHGHSDPSQLCAL